MAMPEFYSLRRGASPLVLSIPHAGTALPPEIASRLAPTGLSLVDTDWWLERLYGPLADATEATLIAAKLSRYVIDLNRDPSGVSLYPGRSTTELVPTTTFDGEPLYRPGDAPGTDEIAQRRRSYFEPYHQALAAEIARVKAAHGCALLYDCHSIRSVIPRLFAGTLPVFNLGTNAGASCASSLEAAIADVLMSATGFTHIVNGRFKGGWITRHYGQPAEQVHAVQMELACRAYMAETPPFAYDERKAEAVQAVFAELLDTMLVWGKTAAGAQ